MMKALLLALMVTMGAAQETGRVPASRGVALDGHAVELPRDLSTATVLVVGFSRDSETQTTEWGRHVRTELMKAPAIGFYEMPMLASVPSFLRGMVTRSIRKKIPETLQPNFVPVTQDEDAWKRIAGFSKDAPDAAYVLLVDRGGVVHWRTRAIFSLKDFAELVAETHKLANKNP